MALRLTVFILEDALSVWTNLGKHVLFIRLCVSSMKAGTRCNVMNGERKVPWRCVTLETVFG